MNLHLLLPPLAGISWAFPDGPGPACLVSVSLLYGGAWLWPGTNGPGIWEIYQQCDGRSTLDSKKPWLAPPLSGISQSVAKYVQAILLCHLVLGLSTVDLTPLSLCRGFPSQRANPYEHPEVPTGILNSAPPTATPVSNVYPLQIQLVCTAHSFCLPPVSPISAMTTPCQSPSY